VQDWLGTEAVSLVMLDYRIETDTNSVWCQTGVAPAKDGTQELDTSSIRQLKQLLLNPSGYGWGTSMFRPCHFSPDFAFLLKGDSLGTSLLLASVACEEIQLVKPFARRSQDFSHGFDSLMALTCRLAQPGSGFVRSYCPADTASLPSPTPQTDQR